MKQNENKKSKKTEDFNAKITELTSDLQRTRADFENYRKQAEIQKQHHAEIVKNATVLKLLPLLDNIELAIKANPNTLQPLQKSLEKTLEDLDLKVIDSKPGIQFNPDLHEAVMVEGDGDQELISETLRPGYYYEGQLIRPAMVKIKKQ